MFVIEKKLHEAELKQIMQECNEFIISWQSHDTPLKVACELYKNRILIFRNDEDYNAVGGCAIDKLFHFIQTLEKKYNTSLLNRRLVVYENSDGKLNVIALEETDTLVQKGWINDATIVYNNSITHSSDMGRFRQYFQDSWIQMYFISK